VVDETGKCHELTLSVGDPGQDLKRSFTSISMSVAGGLRTVQLSRAMQGDAYTFHKAELLAGLDVNSALGADGAPWAKQAIHSNNDQGTLQLGASSNGAGQFDAAPFYKAHAILMTVCFAVLLPFGILVSRFRHQKLWFVLHRAIQSMGLLCAIAGFVVIVVCYNKQQASHFVLLHAKVGLAAAVMTVLQPLNAVIRPNKPSAGEAVSSARIIWELVHKKMGYTAVLVAWANIILGFDLHSDSSSSAFQNADYDTLVSALQATFYLFTALSIVVGFYLSFKEMAAAECLDAPSKQIADTVDSDLEHNLLDDTATH